MYILKCFYILKQTDFDKIFAMNEVQQMKKKMSSKIFTAVAGILAFFGVSLIGIPRLPFILIVIFCIGYIIVNSVQLYIIKQVKEIEKKYYKKYFKKYNRILTEIRRANDADEWCEKVAQLVDYLINSTFPADIFKQSLYKCCLRVHPFSHFTFDTGCNICRQSRKLLCKQSHKALKCTG